MDLRWTREGAGAVWRGAMCGAVAIAVCLTALPGHADEHRYHGMFLDAQHRLRLEQWGPVVTIGVMKRSRPILGELPTSIEGEEASRYSRVHELVRVKAEVLEVAPPNYLRNPGKRYRIVVEGVELEPDYVSIIEVDALEARQALLEEIAKLRVQTTDSIQRDALYYGGMLCLSALGDAGVLPGYDIPVSMLKSWAFETRIGEEGVALERRSLRDIRRIGAGREYGGVNAAEPAEKRQKGMPTARWQE